MPTFTLIQPAVTVGSGGAADITFSSIPNTYTDLILKVSARTNTAQNYVSLAVRFNGDTSAVYSTRLLYGDGSAAGSGSESAQTRSQWQYGTGTSATANTFGSIDLYIPNYAGNTNKSFSGDSVSENNATNAIAALKSGLWANTAAITSITIYDPLPNNFLQYTTAYLYGVSNA